jgi:hypothetical protein
MTLRPVTINVPEPLFLRIQRAPEHTQRSIDQLFVDALAGLTPETPIYPPTCGRHWCRWPI